MSSRKEHTRAELRCRLARRSCRDGSARPLSRFPRQRGVITTQASSVEVIPPNTLCVCVCVYFSGVFLFTSPVRE